MKFTIQNQDIEIQEAGKGFSIKVQGETVYSWKPGQPVLSTPKSSTRPTNYKEAEGEDFKLLNALGLSTHSTVMIINKLFGMNITWKEVETTFESIKKQSLKFVNRDIEDDIWAILVARVNVPTLGEVFSAVGLNSTQHLVVLGFDRDEKSLYSDIISRGVKAGGVKYGLLPYQADHKVFEKAFSKADIGLDWEDFEAHSENSSMVKAINALDTKQSINQALSAFHLPKELGTFTQFDQDLWRTLKAATPNRKVAMDITDRFEKANPAKSDLKFALNWCLMRLQYHMYKVPVTSDLLKPRALRGK